LSSIEPTADECEYHDAQQRSAPSCKAKVAVKGVLVGANADVASDMVPLETSVVVAWGAASASGRC
jgi:uncharacterized ferredoxin-like protein